MGFFSRLFGGASRPTRSDPFFGTLRYRRDLWVGSAPNGADDWIEVMLVGPEAMSLDRQRSRYETLLQRLPRLGEDARTLIETYAGEQFGAAPSPDFFRECRLIHAMLPNPDDADLRWDIGVAGPWPGFRQRGDDDDPEDNVAAFTIQLRDWQPVSVELA